MKKISLGSGIALSWILPTLVSTAQPFAATQAAGPVTTTNATLNGMVTPRGLPTLAWFDWGTDANYGQTTSPVDAGDGTNVVRISVSMEGLVPDSTYRCRLVASNSAGLTYGWERRFTTGRRAVSWGWAFGSPTSLLLPPAALGNLVNLAAGDYHALALKADGTVSMWGRYNISTVPFSIPPGLSNVMAIAGGRDHSLALQSDGKLVVWGDNSRGQTNVPASLGNVVAISAGDAHSLALRSNGTLAAWGRLGPGEFTAAFVPAGLSNVVAISSGDTHCAALRNNGTVVVWGDNTYGQSNVPPGLSNVVAIASGYYHVLALQSNGTVLAWGSGAGAVLPAGLSNVVQIASGDYYGLALRSDGTVVAWGTTISFGGINPPVGLADVVSIMCGDEFSMALASNTPPQAVSRTLTGPVNRDSILTLANAPRDPNGDLFFVRVLSTPASGLIYQFLSGGRGMAITETNTPVNDAFGRVIFAPGLNEFGAPYTSFSFDATDGELVSPPALVTVNIVPTPTVTVVGPNLNASAVILNFTGLSNATYSVLASSDLTNWTRIGSASQSSPGQFLYSDSSVTNLPRRFFRVRSP